MHQPRLLLVILLIICLQSLVRGQCTTETVESNNFLIEPWTNLYVEVSSNGGTPSTSLDNYNPDIHDRFFYTAKFHDCGDGSAYVSVKCLERINGVQYYLGNSGSIEAGDFVGLVPDNNQPFSSNQDPRLFRYTGGDSVDLTSLESKSKFVSPGNQNRVIYLNPRLFWVTWPFITRIDDRSAKFTFFRVKRGYSHVYVYLERGNRYGLIHRNSYRFSYLRLHNLRFEIIQWRMYKEFKNRNIVTATAIVLKRPNSQWYITLDSDEGEISLPQRYCFYRYRWWRREVVCLNYQTVKYWFYDDAARSRNSTFLKSDIRNQNTVDSRFFEALCNHDGTHRFRSSIDPRKYLAILEVGSGRYRLVALELNENLGQRVSYNFDMSVPALSRQVQKVPRLPCPPDIVRQPDMFTCV